MRRLCGWIAALAALLLISAASGEERSYAAALEAWKDAPLASRSAAVPLDSFTAEGVGLTKETIGGEEALCWRTGLGSVTFSVTAPEKALYALSSVIKIAVTLFPLHSSVRKSKCARR